MQAKLNIDKLIVAGFILYVLLYSFFSIEAWLLFRSSIKSIGVFPKSIFLFIGLFVPCFGLLSYYLVFKRKPLSITVQDCIFSFFILYLCLNLFYVVNTALALEGISIYVAVFLSYLSFKQLFIYEKATTDQVLKIGLAVFGIYFVYQYLFINFDSLIQLSDDVKYQDIVRGLRSLVGTKNVTGMFLFGIFVLHRLLPNHNTSLKYLHTLFQCSTLFLILFIGSRNVYVAVVVYFIIEQLLAKRKLLNIGLNQKIIFGLLVLASLLLSISTNFLSHLMLDTFRFRMKMWAMSFAWIRESPFTGIGVFHFNAIKPLYDLDFHGHPHNDYVRTLLELGIIGFVIYTSIWIRQLSKTIGGAISGNETLIKYSSSILAFMSLSIFDGIHYKMFIMILLMIIWARLDVELVKLKNKKLFCGPTSLQSRAFKVFVFSLSMASIFYPLSFLKSKVNLQEAVRMEKRKEYEKAEIALLKINQFIFYDGVKNPIDTRLGNLAQNQNDQNKALKYYKQTLEKFPFHKNTHKLLAKYHLNKNEDNMADKYLEVLLSMDYKDKFARETLSDPKMIKSKRKLKKLLMETKEAKRKSYFE